MTVDSAQFEQLIGEPVTHPNGSGGEQTPDAMRAELTELLALKQSDRTVIGVEIFGRGPAASVDLQLSGDMKVTFERFGDVSKPAALTAHLMSSLGVAQMFKGPQAIRAGVLMFRLARHHSEHSADDSAREWGSEFLRLAPTQTLDLDDQASRWEAFSSLQALNPAHDSGEDRSAHALACASVVLVAQTGERLVRSGWFLSYVRREVGGMYTPAALGTQMSRVGWHRRGAEGWVKATCPTDPHRKPLRWRFYIVPEGWETE